MTRGLFNRVFTKKTLWNVKKLKNTYSCLALLLTLLLFIWSKRKMKKPDDFKEFYDFLIQSGISPDKAKVIASVAAHETANFSSELYRKHNNCFGFRIPKTWSGRRAYDTKNNYSGYITIVDSVNDYIDWCNRYVGGINESPTIHVENMKRKGYFEDTLSNYLNGVMYWFKQLGNDNRSN